MNISYLNFQFEMFPIKAALFLGLLHSNYTSQTLEMVSRIIFSPVWKKAEYKYSPPVPDETDVREEA